MDPVQALERIVHLLDRAHATGFRVKAYVRALDVVRSIPPDDLEDMARRGALTDLPGIGDSTARVITEALNGTVDTYLAKLDAETRIDTSALASEYRAALRGDCHAHTRWSDGGATMLQMATTARDLGHEYLVVTDHSPRLTVAHGLNRERLEAQLVEVAEVNEQLAPFRVLTGMEVDINEDGSLDLDADLLAQLDIVVASVHSKLRMDRAQMTERMVRAAVSPHVDILGHCTGRLIEKRPESAFDADAVFAACAMGRTAVEINSRPERLDPPDFLVEQALDAGCWFSIDSDAHATGQLEWQPHGCEIAARNEVPAERIVNTLGADDLLAWAAG